MEAFSTIQRNCEFKMKFEVIITHDSFYITLKICNTEILIIGCFVFILYLYKKMVILIEI